MITHLIIIFACLLLSAFFSGMEIAFVSTNKLHLELEKKGNTRTAQILEKFTQKSAQFITTMLVGNNVILVIYGFYMGDMTMNLLEIFFPVVLQSSLLSLLIQTLISTIIVLVLAEFLPKIIFSVYAPKMLKRMAFPGYFFYCLFYYPSVVITRITNFLLKFIKGNKKFEYQKEFSKEELGNYIEERLDSQNLDTEIKIFKNALYFKDVKAREIMVPRANIIGLEVNQSIANVKEKFIETGLSKILIYRKSLDFVMGYVHSFEMFKNPKNIQSAILPLEEVPESMPINEVLNILVKKNRRIAVVIDEYGGTSGMITTEDIVEELFGEIQDEHDAINLIERKIDDNTYHFSAQLEIDYLNETYDLQIPKKENYETLGGFILEYTSYIPQKNDEIHIENFKIQIVKVSNTKIEEIYFCKLS